MDIFNQAESRMRHGMLRKVLSNHDAPKKVTRRVARRRVKKETNRIIQAEV